MYIPYMYIRCEGASPVDSGFYYHERQPMHEREIASIVTEPQLHNNATLQYEWDSLITTTEEGEQAEEQEGNHA